MKIEIDLKIVFLIIAFAILNILELYGILLISIIVHEMVHMLCGLLFRLKIKKIKFNLTGISIEFYNLDNNRKIGNLKQIIIASMGPITNFIIAIICINLNIDESIKSNIVYSNILLGIFNLIPIYPLDGGRVLKGIISILKGEHYGKIKINSISNKVIIIVTAITSFLIVYVQNFLIIIMLSYLWYIVLLENKKFRISMKIFNILENSRNYNIN